ncbi:ABC transporter permease [Phytoactinopolyspora endophytica]|uniref:ABC transporter permease n=1 Tax=Phytoactinopolyspora endophytica TaxID=1642495 RepID=UPI00101D34C3|nr:ABC transporter permease subunit [Phytoactinopolyspora endophytica]
MPVYGGPVMLIIGVLVASADYRWGTLQTILSRSGHRSGILTGRFLGLAVVMTLIAAGSLVLSIICSVVVALSTGSALTLPHVGALVGFLAAMLLITMAWSAVGFLFGVLTRNPATGIAIGLLWTLALENGLSGLACAVPALEGIRFVMLSTNTGAIAHAMVLRRSVMGVPPA